MIVFTVYEPPKASGDLQDRAERLVFIKDSFVWTAAIFPAVWLLLKGLWLEFLLFVGLAAALTWGAETLGAPTAVSAMLLLFVDIVLGYEAGALQGAALERRGWRLAGTVAGRDRIDCERRFLERWISSQPADQSAPAASPGKGDRIASWTATAWEGAMNAIARGRRLSGAKA